MNDDVRLVPETWVEQRAAIRATLVTDRFQPWNESRPEGWPLKDAPYALGPASYRKQLSLHLAELDAQISEPRPAANWFRSCWNWLRCQLARGKLSATGMANGETEIKPLDPPLCDDCDFDPVANKLRSSGRDYSAVRVFAIKEMPTPNGSPGLPTIRSGPTCEQADVTASPRRGPRSQVRARVAAETRPSGWVSSRPLACAT